MNITSSVRSRRHVGALAAVKLRAAQERMTGMMLAALTLRIDSGMLRTP